MLYMLIPIPGRIPYHQELHELCQGRDPRNDPSVRTVKLRGSEPLDWFTYMDRGGAVAPMASFTCTRAGPGVPDKKDHGPPPARGVYPTHCYAFVMVTDGQGRCAGCLSISISYIMCCSIHGSKITIDSTESPRLFIICNMTPACT